MSKCYRNLISSKVEQYADAWAKRYVAPAFGGDVDAALSLVVALSNDKRGNVACAMWRAKVPRPAYRAYLAGAWDHDHDHVIAAAQTRRRLEYMFRYAQFPLPADMTSRLRVWRGTSRLDVDQSSRGYSWTTDRDVACWFAMRYAGPDAPPLVLTATASRSDVALAHDERKESEIVLLRPPSAVQIDGSVESWKAGYDRYQASKQPAQEVWLRAYASS